MIGKTEGTEVGNCGSEKVDANKSTIDENVPAMPGSWRASSADSPFLCGDLKRTVSCGCLSKRIIQDLSCNAKLEREIDGDSIKTVSRYPLLTVELLHDALRTMYGAPTTEYGISTPYLFPVSPIPADVDVGVSRLGVP
jgi:hypothetical protein